MTSVLSEVACWNQNEVFTSWFLYERVTLDGPFILDGNHMLAASPSLKLLLLNLQ